jgi:UDP-N-acetyl-D-galactosamine dehydrogenase
MRVAVVGLGYVGLPLAHAFAKAGHEVFGYDIAEARIRELQEGRDRTGELSAEQLREVRITYTTDPRILEQAEVIVIAIPTPVDEQNRPDLRLLMQGAETVGKHLRKGHIIVLESTVYPGVTEEICGPILERASGLRCGVDFTLGYAPERMNPGDKEHTVDKIVKVVAAQDPNTLDVLCTLYGSIVKAGIHRAPSIKVAEMAKAIENAQRDLNIAYVNEVALLCHTLGIATKDVLAAAATKWNFLRFSPGLVGGHCIGVDPYYLVEKARQLGMHTHIINAGRALNDEMAGYVAGEILDALGSAHGKRVLVLGLTFKEDVPDTRNSKAFEVVATLARGGCGVEVADPYLSENDIRTRGLTPGSLEHGPYDALVLLVPHRQYRNLSLPQLLAATKEDALIYDLKSTLEHRSIEETGRVYRAL